MKSSIVLINNPVAQRASDRKVERASRYLTARGYEVEIFSTGRKGDAERYAREALKKMPYLIIAAGGDGTFNEVINGVAGSEIPMAILPIGTTNVLAKEIGVPENPEGAMEVAINCSPKTVSLGKIVLIQQDKENNPPSPPFSKKEGEGFRYFCLMAGIGFDGEAVFGINERLKKISGKGAYFFSGIKALSGFNPEELTFNVDGKYYSGYSAIIGKAAKYGGNFRITPDAKLTEPTLYICLLRGKKRSDILRYFFGILTGTHLKFKDVDYLKAKSIEIDGNAHIQLDGDYFGTTPAKIEVAPDVLKLIYPR